MLRHKRIDRICCIALAVTIVLACCYVGAAALGWVEGDHSIGYEARLFDQSRVHTIDIMMDDWDSFIQTCTNEEYAACTVIVDGEKYGNVGIRAKGNTSLSSVAAYGNNRYSFKIEFDHYDKGIGYYGLDKLSLNNLIQDKTYLKDYTAYTLMNEMGVAAPLCSFVQINVNGDAWGLYLAVEGVEESFLTRNYGNDYGDLYKPDSLSFGGGRGNGAGFDMGEFGEQFQQQDGTEQDAANSNQMPGGFNPFDMAGGGFDPSQMSADGFDPSAIFGGDFDPASMLGGDFDMSGFLDMAGGEMSFDGGGMMGFNFGGMGSDDVKLQYIDDDPASYPNIFGSAKTNVTDADQERLIVSLKTLSEGEDIESVVDVEAVIHYLVVHNFLCNDDSYTGMMVHNYYLYEENGKLSMIPWDYNLAFGGFSMGGFGEDASGATSTVNSPIDSPVSTGDISSRPMISWIFENEEYTEMYHEIYREFVSLFDSGTFDAELDRVADMIAPYVEADATAFYTYEAYHTGVATLKEFCVLRAQSITGQLDGSIPSTTEGQLAGSSVLVDAAHLSLSDMGEFGMGGGGGMPNMPSGDMPSMPSEGFAGGEMGSFPSEMMDQLPEGFDPSTMTGMPGDMQAPEAADDEMGQPDEGADVAEGSQGPNSFQFPSGGFENSPAQEGGANQSTNEHVILLVGSVVLLLAGILFAKFYKTNR